MRQAQETITIQTRRQGNTDITRQVSAWLAAQSVQTGLLHLFLQHVSAHLTLQEHADRDDLATFFARFEGGPAGNYGEFTSPLTATGLSLPVAGGLLALGARQRLYLYEHRDSPQNRSLVLHFVGV